jgi:hypothetical protein
MEQLGKEMPIMKTARRAAALIDLDRRYPEGAAAAPVSPWRPLKNRIFRDLLLANLVSDIGAFMQGVGAAWLMVSLRTGPLNVALIQTASTLPFFLLVLPAGALRTNQR